ncbi:hypothetical protein REPUB_Repub14bG0002700 [Reevesia pubescens]
MPMMQCLSFLLSLILFNFLFSWGATSDPAYQSLLQCLSQSIPPNNVSTIFFSNSNLFYASVLCAYIRNTCFNTSSTPKPVIIITHMEDSHVSTAVICCQKVGFQPKICSGGHDYEGLSYVSDKPFFVLNMFNLRSISVDMADESAWVGTSATLGELYYNIWKNSKVHGFSSRVCPTVGIGGHLSGAGYGTMVRKYGISVDHIVDAKVVDVNEKSLDKKSMGEDIFWLTKGVEVASFCVVYPTRLSLFMFLKRLLFSELKDI